MEGRVDVEVALSGPAHSFTFVARCDYIVDDNTITIDVALPRHLAMTVSAVVVGVKCLFVGLASCRHLHDHFVERELMPPVAVAQGDTLNFCWRIEVHEGRFGNQTA